MFHIGFINEVYKMLQCICFRCSRLRLSDDTLRAELLKFRNGKRRLIECMVRSKGLNRCGQGGLTEGGCNAQQVPRRDPVAPSVRLRVCVSAGVCVFACVRACVCVCVCVFERLLPLPARHGGCVVVRAAQVLPPGHQPVCGAPRVE